MPARLLVTTLSLLLWFSFSSLASASANVVTDADGVPLIPGPEYYIISFIRGAEGGGVFPVRTGDLSSCEYSIIQSSSDLYVVAPLKFHVVGTSTDKIYSDSTDLEIEFVIKPLCLESSKWAVTYDFASSSLKLVMGGPEGNLSGVFRIQGTAGSSYVIVFCPKSFSVSGTCYDVGVDGGRNLVVIEGNSEARRFPVIFLKPESAKGKFVII